MAETQQVHSTGSDSMAMAISAVSARVVSSNQGTRSPCNLTNGNGGHNNKDGHDISGDDNDDNMPYPDIQPIHQFFILKRLLEKGTEIIYAPAGNLGFKCRSVPFVGIYIEDCRKGCPFNIGDILLSYRDQYLHLISVDDFVNLITSTNGLYGNQRKFMVSRTKASSPVMKGLYDANLKQSRKLKSIPLDQDVDQVKGAMDLSILFRVRKNLILEAAPQGMDVEKWGLVVRSIPYVGQEVIQVLPNSPFQNKLSPNDVIIILNDHYLHLMSHCSFLQKKALRNEDGSFKCMTIQYVPAKIVTPLLDILNERVEKCKLDGLPPLLAESPQVNYANDTNVSSPQTKTEKPTKSSSKSKAAKSLLKSKPAPKPKSISKSSSKKTTKTKFPINVIDLGCIFPSNRCPPSKKRKLTKSTEWILERTPSTGGQRGSKGNALIWQTSNEPITPSSKIYESTQCLSLEELRMQQKKKSGSKKISSRRYKKNHLAPKPPSIKKNLYSGENNEIICLLDNDDGDNENNNTKPSASERKYGVKEKLIALEGREESSCSLSSATNRKGGSGSSKKQKTGKSSSDPLYAEEDNTLPEGWRLEHVPRKNSTHVDKYWYTKDTGTKLRSRVEVTRFLQCMKRAKGDETKAVELYGGKKEKGMLEREEERQRREEEIHIKAMEKHKQLMQRKASKKRAKGDETKAVELYGGKKEKEIQEYESRNRKVGGSKNLNKSKEPKKRKSFSDQLKPKERKSSSDPLYTEEDNTLPEGWRLEHVPRKIQHM